MTEVSAEKTYWVGGATGFLGSHLSENLKHAGFGVRAISRGGGQGVQALDIFDREGVVESARGCDGAFVCIGKVSRDQGDAEELHRLHVDGMQAVLDALREAGVPRVVVASTSGTIAVGTEPDVILDETAPAPMGQIASWPYYRTKYYGEKVALAAAGDGFEVVVVNPSLLLGPGDLRESSTGDVRRFLEKSVMASPAGGMAFVDVRDAAEGMRLAMEKGRSGERYILNGSNMTVQAFFRRLSRITGLSAPLFRLPRKKELALGLFGLYEKALEKMGGAPPVDAESIEIGQHYWYCSAEKAETELGFTARDPGQTLRDTVHDLVERRVVAPPELRPGA